MRAAAPSGRGAPPGFCNAARIESSDQRSTTFLSCGRCRGETARARPLRPLARTMASRTKSINPVAIGGLNPLQGTFFQQAKHHHQIVIGDCLQHGEQSLIGRNPQERMHDFDGQPGAARGQQSVQQRFGVAERARRASGHDVQGFGVRRDLFLLARSPPSVLAIN